MAKPVTGIMKVRKTLNFNPLMAEPNAVHLIYNLGRTRLNWNTSAVFLEKGY